DQAQLRHRHAGPVHAAMDGRRPPTGCRRGRDPLRRHRRPAGRRCGFAGLPGRPATPGMDPPPTTLKSDNGKVRIALQNMLNQHNLTYVVLSDTVLITTEDLGFYRQMRQRVNVDVADKSLAEILKQLSDETGVNLVLDPRQADKAKGKIAIQLDDVTLDTALKLL